MVEPKDLTKLSSVLLEISYYTQLKYSYLLTTGTFHRIVNNQQDVHRNVVNR